jgi:hypothetical protein
MASGHLTLYGRRCQDTYVHPLLRFNDEATKGISVSPNLSTAGAQKWCSKVGLLRGKNTILRHNLTSYAVLPGCKNGELDSQNPISICAFSNY